MSWLASAHRRLLRGCWHTLVHCRVPRLSATQRSPKSHLAIILWLVFGFFTATGFGPVGYVESREARYPLLSRQVAQIQRLAPPPIDAYAAIVMEGQTGGVVYERHAHERLPMASMTKMMTALLAIERGKLDQVVTVQVNAADYPDSSLMGLTPGERLTLEDLLYGLMLPSGNDAAIAIARVIGGDEATFVNLMNRRAAELGLADTHFANPHGLDHPAHYSSAYDMARLARYAMGNPVFARIVGTTERVVQGRSTYQLRNTNQLLFQRPDVRGVKTGHTEAAGRCLTAVAVNGGHHLFVVVMRSPDYVADTTKLIDHFYDNYTWLPLNPPPSPLYGSRDQRPPAPETVFLPDWKAAMLRAELQDDGGPTLVFSLGDTIYGRLKLNLN